VADDSEQVAPPPTPPPEPQSRLVAFHPVDPAVDPSKFKSFIDEVVPNVKCQVCGNNEFTMLTFYDPTIISAIGFVVLNRNEKNTNSFYAGYAINCQKCGHFQFFNTQVVDKWAEARAQSTENKK
jgi:hypothetical protein